MHIGPNNSWWMGKGREFSNFRPHGIAATKYTGTTALALRQPSIGIGSPRLALPAWRGLGMKAPGVGQRTLNGFLTSRFSKMFLGTGGGMSPFLAAAGWAVAAAAFGTGQSLARTVTLRRIEKPANVGTGSGFISWSKSSGMPANHLSTNGLSLALSNMRHSSTI